VDLDVARDYLRRHHRGVLATVRGDGTPQMSPVTTAVLDDGAVVISSRETAVKTKNVRRDPRAWLCAFPDGFFPTGESPAFVQVEARVSVVPLPQAMDGLVAYYRAVSGEHPDWEDYRAAMVRDRRVLLRLDLTRAGPDVAG
jgi:PPOX class probable F420-dependent enzyme